jgi:ComF family protein
LTAPEPFGAEFFCVTCRTPFHNHFPLDESGRCGLCRSGLRGFDAAYCYGGHDGVLRQLVHLFKYGKIKTLSGIFGGFLQAALPRDEVFDVVIPVPLHWRKQWKRGFNQSELLAREISRYRGVPMVNALKRVRATLTQAGLSNTRRRQNVAGAFQRRRGARWERRIAGRRILLVDDVMTTGSTAAACAAVLKRAGAARVALLTVARVDRRLDGPVFTADSMVGGVC